MYRIHSCRFSQNSKNLFFPSMFLLQKKLILHQTPMLLYLHPSLKLQAGQAGTTQKNDQKRIIQYMVVDAVGWMCIVA
jgi:hypothetical protein